MENNINYYLINISYENYDDKINFYKNNYIIPK